ncbi:PREDICTED: schlafen family member 13-like [Nipponia nippon]|uniref:schlafen family member 13-like n=1 Tax=Nipponia nippon TaxID=128390 RepID=UPI00051108CB|nr:PREDICTED: schlafen family member 13-like [Nipponia nippon]
MARQEGQLLINLKTSYPDERWRCISEEQESCAKRRDENGPSAKKALLNFDGGAKETPLNAEEHNIQDAAARFLKRDKLMFEGVLDLTEMTRIEFKNFSTGNILEYIRKTLPNYISAFANAQGGYLFFGVDDSSKVIGNCSGVKKEALEKTVADTAGSMPVHHFCGSQADVQFKTSILSVYDRAERLQGYERAVRAEALCRAVFHDNPESRIVMGDTIERRSVRKWTELVTAADPVGSKETKWKPETICADLFSEYPALEDLMKKQIHPLNTGVPIFSRSWAVDVGLRKKQDIVCDVLLVAENAYPVLYTVVKDASLAESGNSREAAYALEQKLVHDGGDASKDDIVPCRDVPALLRAPVIVVLRFKSCLSDDLGCEIFSLLTPKQYELLSENLHKVKEQFVLGLPGTGKTTVALEIIKRIRNIFSCSAEERLYICENEALKKFVGDRTCRSVTRTAFLHGNFPEVKHIAVDETQNFFKKKSGIFWVFLVSFQSTHPYGCGLNFSELYPWEWLTKVVRNARQIRNCRVSCALRPAEDASANVIVLDSIRRVSGLERRIVFGINPVPAQEEITLNLWLCAASRANTKLHLLYDKENTLFRDVFLNVYSDLLLRTPECFAHFLFGDIIGQP